MEGMNSKNEQKCKTKEKKKKEKISHTGNRDFPGVDPDGRDFVPDPAEHKAKEEALEASRIQAEQKRKKKRKKKKRWIYLIYTAPVPY